MKNSREKHFKLPKMKDCFQTNDFDKGLNEQLSEIEKKQQELTLLQ